MKIDTFENIDSKEDEIIVQSSSFSPPKQNNSLLNLLKINPQTISTITSTILPLINNILNQKNINSNLVKYDTNVNNNNSIKIDDSPEFKVLDKKNETENSNRELPNENTQFSIPNILEKFMPQNTPVSFQANKINTNCPNCKIKNESSLNYLSKKYSKKELEKRIALHNNLVNQINHKKNKP